MLKFVWKNLFGDEFARVPLVHKYFLNIRIIDLKQKYTDTGIIIKSLASILSNATAKRRQCHHPSTLREKNSIAS